ncbi:MAG: sugar ABC transporter substrate-binding protein [Chloroflexi bacterium]|nr:sugar ABC transporter substrate-binding protein [Anaerolineaceae bacterium]NMB90488.1 sugar ABC transporter substrate-binding protein [Chloroflexota bacterium]
MHAKSFKKILYLCLLIVFTLSAVRCTPQAPAAPAESEAAPAASEETTSEEAPSEEAPSAPAADEKPFAGTELTLASMTDQYVAAFRALIPQFEEETGIIVTMDELGYGDLFQKMTADFVGNTAQYDLITMDIVWSGQYATNQYSLPLDDFMERDKDELDLDDIMPVAWTLGEYEGQHWAYPLAGYANVLNYRTDLFEAAGLEPPTTQEELLADAEQLTKDGTYGIALLGAKGSAVAQDYMSFLQQHGASVLDENGGVAVNTPENVEVLKYFGELFQYAPPGSTDYWWDQRETAFRDGQVAMMEGWSIARAGYENPEISNVVGNVDITYAPVSEGMEPKYGFGGWGIAINADSDPQKQEAAWEFIKWVTSPEIQKEWVRNDGAPIRRSTLTDPELVSEYPWFPKMLESFEKGDGDYRPRIPEYSIIEDALGTYVNAFLVGEETAESALEKAQAQIESNIK